MLIALSMGQRIQLSNHIKKECKFVNFHDWKIIKMVLEKTLIALLMGQRISYLNYIKKKKKRNANLYSLSMLIYRRKSCMS